MRLVIDGVASEPPRSQKARFVLAYLGSKPGRHARELLADEFWGDGGTSGRASLSTALKDIRHAMGHAHAEVLVGDRQAVGLPPSERLEVDVREFDAHIGRGAFADAADLWRGEFLQDCAGQWVETLRERYRKRFSRVLGHLAEQAEERGNYERAVDYARSQVDLAPDEMLVREGLIRRLWHAGDPIAATAEHERFARLMLQRGRPIPTRFANLIETLKAQIETSSPLNEATASPSDDRPPPTENDARRSDFGGRSRSVSTAEEAIELALDQLAEPALRSAGPDQFSGFADLDALTGGLIRPGLTVVAARPGTGSTTLVLAVALNVAIGFGEPTVLFTPELTEEEVSSRLLAMHARIRGDDLRRGRVPQSRWGRILRASSELASAPFFVSDDPKLSVEELGERVVRLPQRPAVCIVDDAFALLGHELPPGDQIATGHLLSRLRRMARELNVAMVVTMEVSRRAEQRSDKRPVIADVPGFGEIGARPDQLWLLYRDDLYYGDSDREGLIDVIVADSRRGATGLVELAFLRQYPAIDDFVADA
jgi:DNA-binding SARP family transcriptional activator/KaiC/GvpD/RAD55 family RecA-like ATPase